MNVYRFGLESKLTWVSKLIVVSAWNRPLPSSAGDKQARSFLECIDGD